MNRPGLAIAGVAGALLSIYSPLSRTVFGSWDDEFLGAWLGLALAAYLACVHRNRSAAKALSLVAASVAAWFIAFQITVWTAAPLVNTGGGHQNPLVVLPFFLGGFAGAGIVSITTLYLYGGSGPMGRRILACSIAGGVLGAIGYPLGVASSTVSGYEQRALLVIWQTGVSLCMGLVWPSGDTATVDAAGTQPRPRQRVPVLVKIFVAAVVLLVAWPFTERLRMQSRIRQSDRAIAEYRARQPELQGLPAAIAGADDERLILSPIGGHPVKFAGHYLPNAGGDRPQTVVYSASYKNPTDEFSNVEVAGVMVTQYPTAEWAAYAVAGTSVLERTPAAVVRTFGPPVLASSQGIDPTDVYWQSGVFAVRVRSPIGGADEFIRAYLERYPSTP